MLGRAEPKFMKMFSPCSFCVFYTKAGLGGVLVVAEDIELLSWVVSVTAVTTSLDFSSITKLLASALSKNDVLVQQTEDSRLRLLEGAAETSARGIKVKEKKPVNSHQSGEKVPKHRPHFKPLLGACCVF